MATHPFGTAALNDQDGARRVTQMTEALDWLRLRENGFVVFIDGSDDDRFVQFATASPGCAGEEVVAAAAVVPQPVFVLAAVGLNESGPGFGTVEPATTSTAGWASRGSHFGEPGHEPLLMEVGSGLWPASGPGGPARDASVVAQLGAHGLVIGGGAHDCRNFCREGVTEPSDILAALCDHILVEVLHAGGDYQLIINRGQF